MDANSIKFKTVDEYIGTFPASTKAMLKELRNVIKTTAPAAAETISYNMPAYKQDGMLAYFAGYKGHIGFYPGADGIAAFKKELSIYKGAKGSVQFPLDEPLPIALIKKIVKFKIAENRERAKSKKK